MSEEEENNDRRRFSGSMPSSDWVKTAITIVVQSIAVGFFLASVKSDVGHLTTDFGEFKKKTETTLDNLTSSFTQIVQMKNDIKTVADDNLRTLNKNQEIEKQVRDNREIIQELKFEMKNTGRDIDALRETKTLLADLQKKYDELKQKEYIERKDK